MTDRGFSLEDIRTMARDAGREGAREGVREFLLSLGINAEMQADVIEFQKDMAHLRGWRLSMLAAKAVAFKTTMTTLVTGAIGALIYGFSGRIGH